MKSRIIRKLTCKPLCIFTLVSIVLIAIVVVVNAYTQSKFFEKALIEREAAIVRQMVIALAAHHLRAEDFDDYASTRSQWRFEEAFSGLIKVPEVVRLKLYNSSMIIVWSDAPGLTGKYLPKTEEHLARIWAGIPSGIFDPTKRLSHAMDPLPKVPLIEFYIPITFKKQDKSGEEVKAVVAVYRLADELVNTVRRGLLLLWLVSIIGGILLFLALFHLFRAVYRRQREVENKFYRLNAEHERVVQMEKLSIIGRMVSEIAHQFNNPLVGVINLAQLAEREADKPERTRELLGEIRKAGEHCRGFMQRMLRFSQLARSAPQPTEITGLARDTIAFFAQSVANAPSIEVHMPDDEVVLQVDPVLLRHALFNLINNAAQADPTGHISITLSPEVHDGIGGWAIAIADHGPGLSPEVMEHLYTPFFTTRQNGTGLGLSVVQHIVVQHGGQLRAENMSEGGARFIIWLPE